MLVSLLLFNYGITYEFKFVFSSLIEYYVPKTISYLKFMTGVKVGEMEVHPLLIKFRCTQYSLDQNFGKLIFNANNNLYDNNFVVGDKNVYILESVLLYTKKKKN